MWSVQTRITWANCILLRQKNKNKKNFFFLTFFFKPSCWEKREEGRRWRIRSYRLLQCPEKTDNKIQRKRSKTDFFFYFFCFFFRFFLKYWTIKRATKSHQFPLVLCIVLEKAQWRRERYRNMKEGTFFSFQMGTQDYKMDSVNKRHFLGTTFKDALSL